MFTFQKEVIINSPSQFGTIADDKVLIDGMVYDVNKIDKVYYTPGSEGKKAVINIETIESKMDDTVPYEVNITLGLDKQYRGDFASIASYLAKEVSVYTTKSDLAAALKKAMPADLMTVAGKIMTAVDTCVVVKKIEVVKADGTVNDVIAARTTENNPEFGTYDYIMRNLRIPTLENTRYKSPTSVELPVYDGVYDQYSFAYDVERNIGGVSVVGQKTTSRTIHTFYVLNKLSFPLAGEVQLNPDNNAENDNAAPTEE